MGGTLRHLPLVTLLLLALAPSHLAAQRFAGGGGLGLYGLGPRLGENVTLALEMREELNLNADQVRSLQELQGRLQEDVTPIGTEIDLLRSRITAGEVTGAQGILQLETLLSQYQLAAEPYRVEVAAVLTRDQHLLLQGAMFETRPGLGWGLGQGNPGMSTLGPPRASTRPGFGAGFVGRPGLGRGLGRGAVGYGRRALRSGRRVIWR